MQIRWILMITVLISTQALAKKHDQIEKTEESERASEDAESSNVGSALLSGKEAFEKMVEDLRSGIGMAHAESLSMGGGGGYPVALDKQVNGPCQRCFTDAMGDPVADPRWVKTGHTYTFTDGDYSASFTYDPAMGKIEVRK